MKRFRIGLLIFLFISPSLASSHFMTARDLGPLVSTSNIKLKNTRTTSKIVYGLYIRQLSYVLPGQTCTGATVIYPASSNTSAGAIAMSVNMAPNEEADIGPGLLYNMIYGAQYYAQTAIPSPPGCSLPGCTWGSDTTKYHWCLQIGALAPVTTSPGFTATHIVPANDTASNGSYDFNLVSSYQTLGPISCNDQSLTCSITSSQVQNY